MLDGSCLLIAGSDKDTQSLEVVIVDGSGEGELDGINGSMDIVQDDGIHAYEPNYKL